MTDKQKSRMRDAIWSVFFDDITSDEYVDYENMDNLGCLSVNQFFKALYKMEKEEKDD